MASPLSASAMLAALRAEGVDVAEYKSWRTHNRNHVGSWGPVHGVVIHHTVSSGTASSVELCYSGHATLPGPLCHTVGAKDGRLYMVGHGRANHAGLGDGDVLRAVIDETPLPPDNEANTDGNRHFYGIELINLGDGKDPWPEVQKEAAVRWAAAICRAHGWSERSVIAHKEWQPGKVDPTFDMAMFRARVAERLTRPAGWSPGTTTPPPEEDDMTPEQAAQLKSVYERLNVAPWTYKGTAQPTRDAFNFLVTTDRNAKQALDSVTELAAKVDALEATPVTDAQIAQIAAAVASSPVLADAIADKLAARLAN